MPRESCRCWWIHLSIWCSSSPVHASKMTPTFWLTTSFSIEQTCFSCFILLIRSSCSLESCSFIFWPGQFFLLQCQVSAFRWRFPLEFCFCSRKGTQSSFSLNWPCRIQMPWKFISHWQLSKTPLFHWQTGQWSQTGLN